MTHAGPGSTVRFNYVGRLDDGSTFDSTEGAPPIEAVLGDGSLVPMLENELLGMTAGDKKTFRVPAEEAFGPKRQELVCAVPRDRIRSNGNLQVGSHLTMTDSGGNSTRMVVTELTETSAMLDGNHPLAGQDLTIDLELVEVK